MNLQEATELINDPHITSVEYPTTWMDLGCGSGLFSRALGNLIQPGSLILGVDKRPVLKSSMLSNGTEIRPVKANFETDELPVNSADGILMANSFHYVAKKELFLSKLLKQDKNHPAFIVVEYETLLANQWVPYPIDFAGLAQLFNTVGFNKIKMIGKHPSIYRNGHIYAALLVK